MKRFFLSLVALVMATISFAQSKLVATLTHGDSVKVYYGARAFESAYYASESGDVITLSGGEFKSSVFIKHPVTIRGTGIDSPLPTRLSGYLDVWKEQFVNDTCRFSVEGVIFDKSIELQDSIVEPYFLKCQFTRVYLGNSTSDYSPKDAMFVNCKILDGLYVYGSSTAKFSHCYVHNYVNRGLSSSNAFFLNSVIEGDLNYYLRSSFVNSFLINHDYDYLPEETIAMNSVVITEGKSYDPYENMQGSEISCSQTDSRYVFYDEGLFKLLPYLATKYLGTDGTQIGLYGGKYPYNSTPSYPIITKLNVAKQSTADDKLSVDIEVSAAE